MSIDHFDIVGQLEATFNTKPVSIIEFAESSKYCNRILYPRQRLLLKLFFLEELTDEEERILDLWIAGGRNGDEISVGPNIRERMQWLRDNGYKHFREVVLVGGRRCSKGFLTGLSMAKLLFDTLQLQDPGRAFGIDTDKAIVFACVAAAQDQAKEMQYSDFAAMVNACSAMNRHVSKMQELEFSLMTEADIRQVEALKRQGKRVQKDLSTIRGKALPANARTLRGMTMMGIVFDEFAHFLQGESDQSDSEVYSAATPSLAQFGRHAMIFCNSSPYSKVGTFYERYEEGMALDNDKPVSPSILSIRFPSWALFDGWWEDPTYIGPKKCITVSPDWDWERKDKNGEYFYTEEDRQSIIVEQQVEASDPQKYKVERRGSFAEVVDAFLNPDMVDRMFAGRPYWDDEEDCIQFHRYHTNWNDSTYRYRYRAHLDPSSTTAGFGFALGHTEIFEFEGKSEEHVVFDIIKRWNPRDYTDDVIDWDPILEEVLALCDLFRPEQLTFDQHQSRYPIQWLQKELRKRGIGETRVFEKTPNIQTNWFRAETFRTALYQGLIHAPSDTSDCHYAGLELKYLQEIKTARVPRVEKQDEGPIQTKDMADCMMEVVEAFIGNSMSVAERRYLGESPLRMGSPGGYQLGMDGGASPRAREFSNLYARRKGEQSFGGGGGGDPRNPARRPFGGRPVPRPIRTRRMPNF